MGNMPRRRLTREESKARTRQQVLDAAHKLFRRKGFAGTSLDEIAEEAGLTKGAVYSNFANKEELFLSFLDSYSRLGDVGPLTDLSVPYSERMRRVGVNLARDMPADPYDVALALELKAVALRNPRLRRSWATRQRDETDSLVQWAQQLADEEPGATPQADPQLALIGQALSDGLIQLRAMLPDRVTEELFGRAFELIGQARSTTAVDQASE
jgi:AcrR family transcriptional regulator